MKPDVKRSGWITFIVLAVGIAGYLVYHYAYLVYQEYDYYTHYEDVHGLQRSSKVYINGVKVGEVSDINISEKNSVEVTLSIDKHTFIPKGTVALLASDGILGNKKIELQPGEGPDRYTHLDVLTGMYDTSVMDMSDQIEPMVESVKYILGTADKNLSNFNRRVDNGLVEQAQKDIVGMERSMNTYSKQATKISASAGSIMQSVRQMKTQTDKIAGNSKKLGATINNADSTMEKMAKEPIEATVNELRSTVSKAKEQATAIENSTMVKEAISNPKTYNSTTETLQKLNKDMTELKDNPPGMSLIGGGK